MTAQNPWIRFLRNYGPIPTNDNMYDETIQRVLKRQNIAPIQLPAQFLEELLGNFSSKAPDTYFLTGTAGDGKTFHCREVFVRLGGSADKWNEGAKIQTLAAPSGVEIVFVKDLSELKHEESAKLLADAARDIVDVSAQRVYLIAANHGQLLEKLKTASDAPNLIALAYAIETMMVTGQPGPEALRLKLRDLSRSPVAGLINQIISAVVDHPGWDGCSSCDLAGAEGRCPIRENRRRLKGEHDSELFKHRLMQLVQISEYNGHHFPVRQLLVLVTNILLGHPRARDGLMTCADVAKICADGEFDLASIYRNAFGENLPGSRAERIEPFVKLSLFGIGSETSNAIDNILVYGNHDPNLREKYAELMLVDADYGANRTYANAQNAYLEGREAKAEERFLALLRAQRQRLFFMAPDAFHIPHSVWDLTVFKFAQSFLEISAAFRASAPIPRESLPLLVRGLNRVFSGMLVQNQDDLILATSGSHSQTKTSPLIDTMVSVPKRSGEEVTLVGEESGAFSISVRLAKPSELAPIALPLTPTRFEFLCRVAEGALPSSFSLECHEDFLAFKARLLGAAADLRRLNDEAPVEGEDLLLCFLDVADDGRAISRRVNIKA